MASPRVVEPGEPVPKGGGVYRVGKPYLVAGRMYVPEENTAYRAEGIASWYGDDFHGRLTANGEVFDKNAITAAHPTLPIPSYVRVTNLRNRRSLIVRVNDRGPYHSDRLIDVSGKAADLLGFHDNGVARVQVEYVGRAPLEGTDDRMLVATLRQGEPAQMPSTRLASAKPFVPRPHGSSGLQGQVPLPPDRPFNLGEQTVASAEPVSPSGPDDRPTLTRTAQIRTTGEPAPRMTPQVSAFAPARAPSATMMPGVMSGRGLY